MSWEDIGYLLGHVNIATTMKVYGRPTARDLSRRMLVPDL